MPVTSRAHFLADLRGVSRLAVEGTIGVTNLVETMHHNIVRVPGVLGRPTQERMRGVTGLVYRMIRGITHLVGGGMDAVLTALAPQLDHAAPSTQREALLAALNGVLGDHLAASDNPLTIPMRLRRDGQPLELTPERLAADIPQPGGKILLLAHGLCLNDLQWLRKGHDHGAALAADAGFTPVYLHYNSGLHISTNGRAFAELIETLLRAWPVPVDELVLLGHSMGGLVARSACHYGKMAGHDWLRHLRKIVFLATPHHGSPLERGGNWIDIGLGASPYTAALARLGKIRSAGITDLRHGNLLDEDWEQRDRFARAKAQRPAVVPLPEGVQCYAVGASIPRETDGLKTRLVGDGLVLLPSALGQHADPDRDLSFNSQRWIGYGMHHFDLLERREVYARLCQWLV